MLILFALGATVLILGLSLFGGTRTGLWWGWPIAMFLLPWRLYTRVGALTIDLTLVAEALFLAGMLMKPEKQGMKYRWLATDSFVILLMLSLTVTLIKFKLFGWLERRPPAPLLAAPVLHREALPAHPGRPAHGDEGAVRRGGGRCPRLRPVLRRSRTSTSSASSSRARTTGSTSTGARAATGWG